MHVRRYLTKCLLLVGAALSRPSFNRERSALSECRVESILIYGTVTFVRQVSEALSLLKTGYPYGYSLAHRYIHAIVQSNSTRGMGIALAVIFQRASDEGNLPVTPDRLAANPVRHAIAFRKLLGFQIWRSARSELASLNRELHAMRLLKCDARYFHRPSNLVLQLERQLGNRSRERRGQIG